MTYQSGEKRVGGVVTRKTKIQRKKIKKKIKGKGGQDEDNQYKKLKRR